MRRRARFIAVAAATLVALHSQAWTQTTAYEPPPSDMPLAMPLSSPTALPSTPSATATSQATQPPSVTPSPTMSVGPVLIIPPVETPTTLSPTLTPLPTTTTPTSKTVNPTPTSTATATPPVTQTQPLKWGPQFPPATEFLTSNELALLEAIDYVRLEAGLPQTILVADFVLASRDRAAELAALPLLTHNGLKDVSTRLRAQGWTWTVMMEVLARKAPTPGIAFAALMDSPTHKAVILNDEAPYIGIGAVGDAYAVHFFDITGDSKLIVID